MINNNRQQNGRRRGRGGQRQGGGGNQGNGSRIDNRARGNAVQLLEKYKSLASEAQRQGDRVNTEYYLQFADHYFRVVSEQRGRFEDQDRQRQGAPGNFDDDDVFDDGDDQDNRQDVRQDSRPDNRQDSRDAQPPQRESRRAEGDRDGNRDGNRDRTRDNAPRDGRNGREPLRRDRDDRPAELPAGAAFASEGEPAAPAEQQDRPRRARAPRRETPVAAADTFDVDRLPPSFAPANDGDAPEPAAADGDDVVKPRRRRLRPASEVSPVS